MEERKKVEPGLLASEPKGGRATETASASATTSAQAQPPVYQSLNDSMTSLSLSDSSAPMPYGRRNR